MPKPTTMSGWWKDLLDKRAQGQIALLAELCEVSPRTLHRWQTQDIKKPDLERRRVIRRIAGDDLLKQPNCPKYLRLKRHKHA